MSTEVPMSALEEAEFFAHIARVEGLRAERRRRIESSQAAAVVPPDQRLGSAAPSDGEWSESTCPTSGPEATALQGTCFDPQLPAFLRRQAE